MKVLLKMMMILFFLGGISSCGILPFGDDHSDEEANMADQENMEGEEDDSEEELIVTESEGEGFGDENMEEGGSQTEELAVASSETETSADMETSNDMTMGTYTVEEGDTLMEIAFKLYGDYRVWRQIKEVNQLTTTELVSGTKLRYKRPAQEFVWNPAGNPYLIKRGDTLGSISMDKYRTLKRWRDLYENNRPLIRDPNLIFAGFTIYYVPDLSSEQAGSDSSMGSEMQREMASKTTSTSDEMSSDGNADMMEDENPVSSESGQDMEGKEGI